MMSDDQTLPRATERARATLASSYPTGASIGGHLAFWGRHTAQLPREHPRLGSPDGVRRRFRAVVASTPV